MFDLAGQQLLVGDVEMTLLLDQHSFLPCRRLQRHAASLLGYRRLFSSFGDADDAVYTAARLEGMRRYHPIHTSDYHSICARLH